MEKYENICAIKKNEVRSFHKISKQNMFKIHNTKTVFPVAQGDSA